MGLASLLLGEKNPFAQWVTENQNKIGAVGGGLAAGPSFGEGLSNAAQYAAQAAPLDAVAALQRKAAAEQAQNQTATQQWLAKNYPQYANMPGDLGVKLAMQAEEQKMRPQAGSEYDSRYQAGQQYGLSDQDLNTFALTGALPGTNKQNVTFGVMPIYGTDTATGKTGMGVQGSDGSFKLVDTGGFQPLGPYDLAANKAAGRAFGTGTGEIQFSAPQAEKELAQSLDAIKGLGEQTKGKDEWFGQVGMLPRGMWQQGGSEMAKFSAAANNVIDRSWLSARAMLKGAGQVTDYEGAKAENAVSMMKGALEKGDKALFDTAVTDYEYWIKQGFAKMQQQAGTMDGYGGAPAGGGGDVLSAADILLNSGKY